MSSENVNDIIGTMTLSRLSLAFDCHSALPVIELERILVVVVVVVVAKDGECQSILREQSDERRCEVNAARHDRHLDHWLIQQLPVRVARRVTHKASLWQRNTCRLGRDRINYLMIGVWDHCYRNRWRRVNGSAQGEKKKKLVT